MSKLDVVLVNYNDSHWLINWVEKIMKQYPAELIIVDDQSTDSSIDIIHQLQVRYPIKLVINSQKKGPFGGFISGVKVATSDYVACFSCDDEPLPGYLDKMIEAIEQYPFVDIFTCNTKVMREGREYERILFPFTAYISPDYAVKMFRTGYARMINLCGVVVKREMVLKCWEEAGKNTEVNFDALFSFFSIFDRGFVNLGDNLTLYRSYPNSWGTKGKQEKIRQAGIEQMRMYSKYPQIHKRVLESGILGVKPQLLSNIALWGIMKLPKWVRGKFYDWYFKYDWRIEKL